MPATEQQMLLHDAAMAGYKAALAKFTAEREAAAEARKVKNTARQARAVSPYTVFYNEQFPVTKQALGAPKELGNVAAAIAAKWKSLSESDKQVRSFMLFFSCVLHSRLAVQPGDPDGTRGGGGRAGQAYRDRATKLTDEKRTRAPPQ
jgi:hypothetical protein